MSSETEHRSAIEGHYVVGDFGRAAADDGPGVVFKEWVPSAVWQVNGAPDEAVLKKLLKGWKLAAAPKPNTASTGPEGAWVWTGPGQWLVVSQMLDSDALHTRLVDTLQGTAATLCDLCHARTVIRISGRDAVEVLCKGCSADIETLEPGACLATQLGHFSVTLVYQGDAGFDVYVFRSFGLAMWEWLSEAAAEFGFRVEPAEPGSSRPASA